jgi:hypothetical protein
MNREMRTARFTVSDVNVDKLDQRRDEVLGLMFNDPQAVVDLDVMRDGPVTVDYTTRQTVTNNYVSVMWEQDYIATWYEEED